MSFFILTVDSYIGIIFNAYVINVFSQIIRRHINSKLTQAAYHGKLMKILIRRKARAANKYGK